MCFEPVLSSREATGCMYYLMKNGIPCAPGVFRVWLSLLPVSVLVAVSL
jgi:hypothetical protein